MLCILIQIVANNKNNIYSKVSKIQVILWVLYTSSLNGLDRVEKFV